MLVYSEWNRKVCVFFHGASESAQMDTGDVVCGPLLLVSVYWD